MVVGGGWRLAPPVAEVLLTNSTVLRRGDQPSNLRTKEYLCIYSIHTGRKIRMRIGALMHVL